jgi:hypothetical protein
VPGAFCRHRGLGAAQFRRQARRAQAPEIEAFANALDEQPARHLTAEQRLELQVHEARALEQFAQRVLAEVAHHMVLPAVALHQRRVVDGLQRVHREDDARAGLHDAQALAQHFLVVGNVLQNADAEHDVERVRREADRLERLREELQVGAPSVGAGVVAGDPDEPLVDVDAAGAREPAPEQHRVQPVAAADVQRRAASRRRQPVQHGLVLEDLERAVGEVDVRVDPERHQGPEQAVLHWLPPAVNGARPGAGSPAPGG